MEFNLSTVIRENIKSLKTYASARDDYDKDNSSLIFLDANENPYGNGLNRYPDPNQKDLKTKISTLKGVEAENLFLGNGSDEVLDLIIRAFCEPKRDNILILPPTYGMYEVLANLNAVEVLKIELDNTFHLKVDQILDTQNNFSKLLFLCTPNNPTANSFETEKIEQLIRRFNGIVVIDEAYINFSAQNSWIKRLRDFPNLIVIQTLSKAYGMAGIRLGLCFASKAIIKVLNKIKPPYNINKLTQNEAIRQLDNPEKIEQDIQLILKQRAWLISELKSISLVLKCFPSDANFILIKVDDANRRYKQLIDRGIVVRNRSNQPFCNNCLRITVGAKDENIKLINTLKSLI